jgi:hypothetical protein
VLAVLVAGMTEALAVPSARTALGADRDACIVVLSTDGQLMAIHSEPSDT